MRFLRPKYLFIAVFLLLLIIGIIFQLTRRPWVTLPKTLINQTKTNPSNDIKDIVYNGKAYHVNKQKTISYEQYSSAQMNISFIYPGNLKYKQITPQLVSLSDPSIKATDDNILYIYSTTVPENSIEFKIPFTLPGKLKETKIIKTETFTANQEIYSDGTNEVTFLVLRQNDQTIVIRIPKDSNYVSQAITDIMNSIKTLK